MNMDGGHKLFSVLIVWLISIPVLLTTLGNSDDHAQARRKLAIGNSTSFISIDCGASGDYNDQETGIFYKSDTEYIDTGKNMEISSEVVIKQLKNLRFFPQGTKNCYTLKPEQGKNNNYLIRAFFKYGNYDGKNQAPIFDLYLGVNKWDTVNSSTAGWREIIHFPSRDNIYVCLVNTGFGIPFISTLELRPLNNSIYKIESGALVNMGRFDIGGFKDVLRYPDDIYDRIWNKIFLPDPQRFVGWNLVNTPSAIDTQSSNDAYHPPEEVLRTAAQTQNSNVSLTYTWKNLNTTPEYYVYFHFAEITYLQVGQRELNISLNGEYLLTEPLKLQYLKPVTIGPLSSPIKDIFSYAIFATKESSLPPILNAFEIYELKMLPDSPTNLEDVDAIMDIKKVYKVITKNWQGDPCVPSSYSWDGLNCSNDNPPRIISLNLASSGLTGNIASSLFNLKSIESLDLSNNELTGPVPEFLAQLPSLRTLNLTGNKLSGSIPATVMEKVKDKSLNLSVDENPNLCATDSCAAKKKNKLVVLVASIGAFLVLFLISTLGMIFWHNKRKKREGSLKSKNQKFTYSKIVRITGKFKKVIGEGGFGTVYLGTLKNGDQVSVKVRSSKSWQGQKEFRTEAQLLMRAHHKNLVSLIGYCDDSTHMALVYEYVANGNLRKHLSETNADVLNWRRRLQIAIDAAQGLEYLHNHCEPPIVHRDMKTTNILLNERWQAKIADFGLSRDFKNEGPTGVFTAPVGTRGYTDPEYESTKELKKEIDVYSFGIVLLELITGQPAVITQGLESITITGWVNLRNGIQNIVDHNLQLYYNPNSAMKAVEIAMSCVQPTANGRPDMSHVVAELEKCLEIETKGS